MRTPPVLRVAGHVLRHAAAFVALLLLAPPAHALEETWSSDKNANSHKIEHLPAPAGATEPMRRDDVVVGAGYLKSSALGGTVSASPTIPSGDIAGPIPLSLLYTTSVANVTALEALAGSGYRDGSRVYVQSVSADFVFHTTNATTVDHKMIASVSGMANARWLRDPHADGTQFNQLNWFVNTSSGSDEADCVTSGTACLTFAEVRRRLIDRYVPIGNTQSITITIAGNLGDQDPIAVDMLLVARNLGTSVTVMGTPTTASLGTIASVTAHSYASNQIDQINITALDWTPYVGKIVRRVGTSGTTGQTSVVVATCGSGCAQVTQVSVFGGPGTAWQVGDGVEALTLPKAQGARAGFAGTLLIGNFDFDPGTAAAVSVLGPGNAIIFGSTFKGTSGGNFIDRGGGIAFGGCGFSTRSFTGAGNVSVNWSLISGLTFTVNNSRVGRNEWQDSVLSNATIAMGEYVHIRFHSLGVYSLATSAAAVTMQDGASAAFTDSIYGTGNGTGTKAFTFLSDDHVYFSLATNIPADVANAAVIGGASVTIAKTDIPYYRDIFGNEIQIAQNVDPFKHLAVAGGDLTYVIGAPSQVTAIHETSGPTQLTVGAIADTQVLVRSGGAIIGTATSGFAPASAHFLTDRSEASLSAEVNLGALTTGLLKITVGGGVATPSTAGAGIDYQAPGNYITALTGDGAASGPGSVPLTISNDAITDAKLRNSGPLSLMGRSVNTSGDPADISATAGSDCVFREGSSTLACGTVATAGLGANVVTDSKIRQFAGLSVLGRGSNSTGNGTDITAGSDGDVLRRSGTTLAFGAIPESSVTNLTTDLAGLAPNSAHYLTTQAEAGLTNESSLGALSSGMLAITVGGGVATPTTFVSSAGRVPYGSGSNGQLTDNAGLFFDPTTRPKLGVGTSSPSTGFNLDVKGANADGVGALRVGVTGTNGDINLVMDTVTLGPYLAAHTNLDGTSSANVGAARLEFGANGLVVRTSPATAVSSARTFTNRFQVAINGDTTVASLAAGGIVKAAGGGLLGVALGGVDYEVPLTFSSGARRTGNNVTVDLTTGVAGGQSVVGGTAAGNNLRISSTTNGTKGKVLLGTSAYDEVNDRLGVAIASPLYAMDVSSGLSNISGFHVSPGGSDNGAYLLTTTANQAILSGGSAFNGGSWIAKSTSASIVFQDSGSTTFYGDTGLSAGVGYTPTQRLAVGPSGVDVPSLSAGGITKSLVTSGRLAVASSSDIATALAMPSGHRVLAGNAGGTGFAASDEIRIDDSSDSLFVSNDGNVSWRNMAGGSMIGAVNYEQVQAKWVSSVWTLESQKGGTGTVRGMKINAATADLTLNGATVIVTPAAASFGTRPVVADTSGHITSMSGATFTELTYYIELSSGLITAINAGNKYIATSSFDSVFGYTIEYPVTSTTPTFASVEAFITGSNTITSGTVSFSLTKNGSGGLAGVTLTSASTGVVDSGIQSTSSGTSTDTFGISVSTGGAATVSGALRVAVKVRLTPLSF